MFVYVRHVVEIIATCLFSLFFNCKIDGQRNGATHNTSSIAEILLLWRVVEQSHKLNGNLDEDGKN